MASIIFSGPKQAIAEFDGSDLEFAQQDGGILLTASGSMVSQDNFAVEQLMRGDAHCHVAIVKDGQRVIDQQFGITVFAFESDNLVVLLR